MINALIVDDEPLGRERITTLLTVHHDICVVAECPDGESAVDRLNCGGVDVAFIDVQLPGIDGFGIVEVLSPKVLPVVIFVTAHDVYALRAFRAHALDYLLKPVMREHFDRALDKARTYLSGRAPTKQMTGSRPALGGEPYARRVAVRNRDRIRIVRVEDIVWVEAQGNYIRVHTQDGASLTREPLRDFLARVDPRQFVRVGRSAVVNVDSVRELRVDRYSRLHVVLNNTTLVPVSSAYRAAVDAFFEITR